MIPLTRVVQQFPLRWLVEIERVSGHVLLVALVLDQSRRRHLLEVADGRFRVVAAGFDDVLGPSHSSSQDGFARAESLTASDVVVHLAEVVLLKGIHLHGLTSELF